MLKAFAIVLLFIAGCTSTATEDSNSNSDSSTSPGNSPALNTDPSGCYTWKSGNDSAALNLQVSGTIVTGTLIYNLFEKDSTNGSIKGTIKDDLIIADFTFQSKGTTSIREIVLKIDGDNLVEGYGDIDVEGDTARYKNKTELEYHTERPFVKTRCK